MAHGVTETDSMPVNSLNKKTRASLERARLTGRPVSLIADGRADGVILDAATYEKHLSAANLARLLKPAETDIRLGRTRSARDFFREFKHARKISG